jgi:hypothetical protein
MVCNVFFEGRTRIMLLNKLNILLFIGLIILLVFLYFKEKKTYILLILPPAVGALFFQTPLAYTISKPLRISLIGVLGLMMTGIFFILIREAKASKEK